MMSIVARSTYDEPPPPPPRFGWDRAAAAYLALYRRLLGLPPG